MISHLIKIYPTRDENVVAEFTLQKVEQARPLQ